MPGVRPFSRFSRRGHHELRIKGLAKRQMDRAKPRTCCLPAANVHVARTLLEAEPLSAVLFDFALIPDRGLMPQNYVPIFLFLAAVGTLVPVTLLVARLIRTQSPNRIKLMPDECGIDPYDNSRGRYTVRYYIIAILFVIFEVETIFLFPWAVKFKALGVFGLIEMLIFLGTLIGAYVWVWKKGALEWV
jgi:NADH-quinone oxidoreductase subunit A